MKDDSKQETILAGVKDQISQFKPQGKCGSGSSTRSDCTSQPSYPARVAHWTNRWKHTLPRRHLTTGTSRFVPTCSSGQLGMIMWSLIQNPHYMAVSRVRVWHCDSHSRCIMKTQSPIWEFCMPYALWYYQHALQPNTGRRSLLLSKYPHNKMLTPLFQPHNVPFTSCGSEYLCYWHP